MMTIELVKDKGEEKLFLINDNGPLMTLSLTRMSLLTQRLFIWIEFHSFPTLGQLRALRQEFEKVVGGFALFCNVQRSNIDAVRFARFFGFHTTDESSEILIMERDA